MKTKKKAATKGKKAAPKLAASTAVRTSVKPAKGPRGATAGAVEPLETTIARVLGEAHEPVPVAEIERAVLRAGHRVGLAVLLVTCRGMVTDGHASEPRKGCFWTPEQVETEAPSPEQAPPTPRNTGSDLRGLAARESASAPTVAALLAKAERKTVKVREPITFERAELLRTARAEHEKEADRLTRAAKYNAGESKRLTRAIRLGFEVREVITAVVPDYAHRQLVTYDVGGKEPRVLSVKPLPRKYGEPPVEQTDLPFAAGKGAA